jgi:hypothetical protein
LFLANYILFSLIFSDSGQWTLTIKPEEKDIEYKHFELVVLKGKQKKYLSVTYKGRKYLFHG